jgi:hypothetical protein
MARPHWIVILSLILGTAVLPAEAQRLTDPDLAIDRRQARELERRAVTRDVDQEVLRQRRDLRSGPRGPGLSTQERIIDRQLQAIPPSPTAPRRELPEPVRPGPVDLGRSYAPETELPSIGASRGTASGSSSDTVTMANRLVVRAEQALEMGEPERARRDAEFASRLLGALPEPLPDHPATPRLSQARERLDLLQRRLEIAE